MTSESYQVFLYVYDMSKGLAKSFSQMLLGKELNGIWHTGIVVYGKEYFFGSGGVENCPPGGTILGDPDQIIPLGKTELPFSVFKDYLCALGDSTYRPGTYDLFEHNCNNFSQEVALFLSGKPIPQEILDLPLEVLKTPIGQSIKNYFNNLNLQVGGMGYGGLPSSSLPWLPGSGQFEIGATAFQNPPRPRPGTQNTISSSTQASTARYTNGTRDNGCSGIVEEQPSIEFNDADGVKAVETIMERLEEQLTEEEKQSLQEFSTYLTTDAVGECSLGKTHLNLINHLLSDQFSAAIKILTLRILQSSVLKENFTTVLKFGASQKIMSYMLKIENLSSREQEEASKLMCNLCCNSNMADWLLESSEWKDGGQLHSNMQTTVHVAVCSVLSEDNRVHEKGSVLMYNLSKRRLYEDTATELATAVLQFLHSNITEVTAFQCLSALLRFMCISHSDVPALTKVLGPDIRKFLGKSERVDQLISKIQAKLSVTD